MEVLLSTWSMRALLFLEIPESKTQWDLVRNGFLADNDAVTQLCKQILYFLTEKFQIQRCLCRDSVGWLALTSDKGIRILTLLTSGTLTSLSICPPLFPFGIIVNLSDITDKILWTVLGTVERLTHIRYHYLTSVASWNETVEIRNTGPDSKLLLNTNPGVIYKAQTLQWDLDSKELQCSVDRVTPFSTLFGVKASMPFLQRRDKVTRIKRRYSVGIGIPHMYLMDV